MSNFTEFLKSFFFNRLTWFSLSCCETLIKNQTQTQTLCISKINPTKVGKKATGGKTAVQQKYTAAKCWALLSHPLAFQSKLKMTLSQGTCGNLHTAKICFFSLVSSDTREDSYPHSWQRPDAGTPVSAS